MYFEFKYLLIVWAVGCLSGISRCLYDGDHKGTAHALCVGLFSGFLALAVVATLGDVGHSDFNPTRWLGIGSIIGLSGREQTDIISFMWRRVLGDNDAKPLPPKKKNTQLPNSGKAVSNNSLGNPKSVPSGPEDKPKPTLKYKRKKP